MDNTLTFQELETGDTFCIPFHLDHEFERFVKLPFNKAKCLLTGDVENFPDLATVWIFEPTSFDTN